MADYSGAVTDVATGKVTRHEIMPWDDPAFVNASFLIIPAAEADTSAPNNAFAVLNQTTHAILVASRVDYNRVDFDVYPFTANGNDYVAIKSRNPDFKIGGREFNALRSARINAVDIAYPRFEEVPSEAFQNAIDKAEKAAAIEARYQEEMRAQNELQAQHMAALQAHITTLAEALGVPAATNDIHIERRGNKNIALVLGDRRNDIERRYPDAVRIARMVGNQIGFVADKELDVFIFGQGHNNSPTSYYEPRIVIRSDENTGAVLDRVRAKYTVEVIQAEIAAAEVTRTPATTLQPTLEDHAPPQVETPPPVAPVAQPQAGITEPEPQPVARNGFVFKLRQRLGFGKRDAKP